MCWMLFYRFRTWNRGRCENILRHYTHRTQPHHNLYISVSVCFCLLLLLVLLLFFFRFSFCFNRCVFGVLFFLQYILNKVKKKEPSSLTDTEPRLCFSFEPVLISCVCLYCNLCVCQCWWRREALMLLFGYDQPIPPESSVMHTFFSLIAMCVCIYVVRWNTGAHMCLCCVLWLCMIRSTI